MAVTGVFAADFSAFYDAVTQAEVHLRSFETGANKVETSLARMGDSFSGRKVIQDATLMAEIFREAGGAAAFTEQELARMGATGAEAVEKMEALGMEIPEGIRAIATESGKATKETEGWAGSVTKLVASYVSIQSMKQVWGFAREIMSDASALEDLSRQTRINTTDLQNLGNALGGFGISMDEIGKAAFGLSKRIAGGDDSVSDALLQMGLSIDQVKALNPVDLILTIADAGGKMNEQFKDASFAALYGDKLGASMAGASKEMRAAYEEQVKLNNAIGPEAVKALADADKEIETFYIKWRAVAAINLFAPIATGLSEFLDLSSKAGVAQTTWARFIDSLAPKAWNLKTEFQKLKEETEALNPPMLQNSMNVNALITGYDGLAPKVASTAGETKKLREEEERLRKERYNPAETMSGFEEATKVAAQKQIDIDNQIRKDKEKLDADQAAHNTRMAAGAGYVKQMGEIAKVNKEAADFEKALATEREVIDKQNEELVASYGELGEAHTTAGAKAGEATAQTVQGYAAVQQQVELSGDAIRAWIELQQYSAAANAILARQPLWTGASQYEAIAKMGSAFTGKVPQFASGIENFRGGLAKVHGGEVLANLSRGTSVLPKALVDSLGGGGTGLTVSNTFNLTDTESNLARRVSELIMRQVRAGTQIGTT